MSKEIETKVEEILAAAQMEYSIQLIGETVRENDWKCDQWKFTIKSVPGGTHVKQDIFDYYTGLGHRQAPSVPYYMEHEHPTRINRWKEENGKPIKPHVTGLLHSIILDGSALDNNFSDWCDEFGYSDDSMKAIELYKVCCETARKLQKLVGMAVYKQLQEVLQDY